MNSIVLTRAFVVIDALDKTGKAYTSVMARFSGMASRIAGIGARLSASMIMPTMALKKIINDYVKFEDQMLSLKAITGSNTEEFNRMCDVARRFGREVTFSVQQVAEAMTEMGRAGFSTKEIEDSFQSVLDFARAARIELKESADFISSTLKTFNAGPAFARQVADSLTATANASAVSPREIMSAMRMSASIAAQVGMDVKDYLEAIGTLGNFGIRGTIAGTVMRRAGTKLANQGKIEQYRNYGVEVLDSKGNMRNLVDILTELRAALKAQGFTDNQIIARLSSQQEFGLYGAAGIVALSNAKDEKGNRRFQELKDALDNSDGLSALIAAEMDSGIGGAIRYLVASLQELNIVLGKALAPMVRNIAGQIKSWTNTASVWFEANQGVVTSAATAFIGLTALGTAMFVVGTAALPLVSTLGMIGEAFVGLTGILSTTFGYLDIMVAEYSKGFIGGLRYAGTAVENRKRLLRIDESENVRLAAEAKARSATGDRARILHIFQRSEERKIEKKRLDAIQKAEADFASKYRVKSNVPLPQPERKAVYDMVNRNRIGIGEADLEFKDAVKGSEWKGVIGVTTEEREAMRRANFEKFLHGKITPEQYNKEFMRIAQIPSQTAAERTAKFNELAERTSPLMEKRNRAMYGLDENFKESPLEWVEKEEVGRYQRGMKMPTAPDNRDYFYALDNKAKKALQSLREKQLNPLLYKVAREREDLANAWANERVGGMALNLYEGEEVRGAKGLRASENAAIRNIGKRLGNPDVLKTKEASTLVAQMLGARQSIEDKRKETFLAMLQREIEESSEGVKLFKKVKTDMAKEAVKKQAGMEALGVENSIADIEREINGLERDREALNTALRSSAEQYAISVRQTLEQERIALQGESELVSKSIAKNIDFIKEGEKKGDNISQSIAKLARENENIQKEIEKLTAIKNRTTTQDQNLQNYRQQYTANKRAMREFRVQGFEHSANFSAGKKTARSSISEGKARIKVINSRIEKIDKELAGLENYVERTVNVGNEQIRSVGNRLTELRNQKTALENEMASLSKVASGSGKAKPDAFKAAFAAITDEQVRATEAYRNGLNAIAESELANKSSSFRAKFVKQWNDTQQRFSKAFSKLQSNLIGILKANEERAKAENAKFTKQRDSEVAKANKTSAKENGKVAKKTKIAEGKILKQEDEAILKAWQEQQNTIKANEEAAPWWRGKINPKKGTQTHFDKMRKAFARSLEYGSEGSFGKTWANTKAGFSEMWKGTKDTAKSVWRSAGTGFGFPSIAEDFAVAVRIAKRALDSLVASVKWIWSWGKLCVELFRGGDADAAGMKFVKDIKNMFSTLGTSLFASGFDILKVMGNGFKMFWGMLRSSWLIALEVFIRVLYYGNYWKAFLGALVVVLAAVVGGFVLMCKIMNIVIVTGSKVIAQFIRLAAGIFDVVAPILLLVGGTCLGALALVLTTVYKGVVLLWRALGNLMEAIGELLEGFFGFSIMKSFEKIADMFIAPIARAFSNIKTIFVDTVSTVLKMFKAGDTESAFEYLSLGFQRMWIQAKIAFLEISANIKHWVDTTLGWLDNVLPWISRAARWLMGGEETKEAKRETGYVREYNNLSKKQKEEYAKHGIKTAEDYVKEQKYYEYLYEIAKEQDYKGTLAEFKHTLMGVSGYEKEKGNFSAFADLYSKGKAAAIYEEYWRNGYMIIDAMSKKEWLAAGGYGDYAFRHESPEVKALKEQDAALAERETAVKAHSDAIVAFNENKNDLIAETVNNAAMNGWVENETQKTTLERLLNTMVQKSEMKTADDYYAFTDSLFRTWDYSKSIAENVASAAEMYASRFPERDMSQLLSFVEDIKTRVSEMKTGEEMRYGEGGELETGFRDMTVDEIFEAWSPGLLDRFAKGESYDEREVSVTKDGKTGTYSVGMEYSKENQDVILRKIMYEAMEERDRLAANPYPSDAENKRLGELNNIIYNLQKSFFGVDEREGEEFSRTQLLQMEEDRRKTLEEWDKALQERAEEKLATESATSGSAGSTVSTVEVRDLAKTNTKAVTSSSTNIVSALSSILGAFNEEARKNQGRWDELLNFQRTIASKVSPSGDKLVVSKVG